MPRRILLVMDDCGAGDALRLSGFVGAVRQAFPAAHVTMVAAAGAVSVYQGSPDVDRVVASRLYGGRLPKWRGRLAKAVELCRLVLATGIRHDLSITFWWGSRLLAALAQISCRGPRIGYGGGNLGAYDFQGDEMEQNAALLRLAGVEPGTTAPRMAVSHQAEQQALSVLHESGWDGRSPVVVLHTGSDWACQQWLPERWAETADALAAGGHVHLVFTGSSGEKDYVRRIRAAMREPSASLAGETTLAVLGAVMGQASLVVTVDSAACVVARARGVSTVVLAGPSHPERLTAGDALVRVLKRMTPATARVIDDCKRPRFPDGGCHNYACPFSGRRELLVEDVLEAVRESGALFPERAVV